jgi:hypothetical protein
MTNPVPAPKPGDWMENAQTLANGVHCFLCYSIVFTNWMMSLGNHHQFWWIVGLEFFLIVFVLVKEYWYDLNYETGETLYTSTEDALGWLSGNILAWVMIGVHHLVVG